MYPSLKPKDQLQIDFFQQPKSCADISVGQVVLTREQGQWVVHRVVQWESEKRIKGDWAMSIDQSTQVWGTIGRINGRSDQRLTSPFLARLSAKLTSRSRVWRRFLRLQLLLVSFALKGWR